MASSSGKTLSNILDASLNKPNVKGILCEDSNGLVIAAKGDLTDVQAGKFSRISKLASSLSQYNTPATVIIETNSDKKIIVKEYDGLTIALKCDS